MVRLPLVFLSFSTLAQAQYIVAGRAAGATYVDLVPDKVLVARKTGVSNALDSLDLDADGCFDLRLAAYTNSSTFPSEAETRLLPLTTTWPFIRHRRPRLLRRLLAMILFSSAWRSPICGVAAALFIHTGRHF